MISATMMVVMGIFVFLTVGLITYKTIYLGVGILVMLLAGICFFFKSESRKGPIQNKGLVLKRKYWLFYTLTFLAGARRQVFVAFAVFLLVKHFDYSVKAIAVLFLINNAVNFFLSPIIPP